ncbi:GIY-YIG nuclease family protein [Streptomyces sp. NPDC055105]|uniref:GIY-YIG nuclease family protein n=1 Tax=Streptomyces sp. NPDC055105 TaxID=3365719 RepID=UPI0037D16943
MTGNKFNEPTGKTPIELYGPEDGGWYTLAQNNQLSLGARGLALYLLTLPAGTPISVAMVCETTGTGRETATGYMRELEAIHLVVRLVTRGARGRLKTICMLARDMTDTPVESVPRPFGEHRLPIRRDDVVYVIGQTGSPVVKIGVTKNLRSRLKGIQTGSPVRLEVLWSQPAGYELEAALHAHFSAKRLEGEWFDFGSSDPVEAVRVAAERFSKGAQG